MIPFLVILGCLIVAYVVVTRFSNKSNRMWLWILGGLCAVSIALMVVAKNYNLILAGLPFLLPLLFPTGKTGYSSSHHSAAGGHAKSRGKNQRSEIQTAFLKMTLDHATNAVEGVVKAGTYQDRTLDSLSDTELMILLQECSVHDPESVQLLEAWLDQTHPGWRQSHGPRSSDMTYERAYQILGLSPGASEQEIKRAYHALIKKVHPDQGGSAMLAAQINQARDLLLGKKKPHSL